MNISGDEGEMHTHICIDMHSYIHIYEVKITFTRTL